MAREPGRSPPRWTRHAGMGVELGAAIVGFCLLGVWIDHRYDTGPWATLICALLGVIGGMFNFIRQALQAVKDQSPSKDSQEDDQP